MTADAPDTVRVRTLASMPRLVTVAQAQASHSGTMAAGFRLKHRRIGAKSRLVTVPDRDA